jgi:hypothetical protein
MIELGYALSSEEHDADALVDNARMAAHSRRPLAVPRRAAGDARGGGRGDRDALGRRLPDIPRRLLQVEKARIYTLPDEPPPIAVAASAPRAAELAGRIGGDLSQELALPEHFEQASEHLSEEDIASKVVPCGPDPERHVEAIREFEAAGIDHVYVHQIGPDQEGFLRFYEREVLPQVATGAPAGARR